jgi:hypothetical protein
MKLKLIALIPILFISMNGFAQHAFFQIGGGYSFPTSTGQAGEITTIGTNGNPTNIKNADSEMGGGIPVTVRAGYMINNYVGADIGFNYLIGNKTSHTRISANDQVVNITGETRQARLNPAIVFSTNRDLDLSAYSRLGLVLPLGGVTTMRYDVPASSTHNRANTIQTEEIRGRFGVGYSGTLGAQYRIYERMYLFAEVEAIHLAVRRTSSQVTFFSLNGNDALNQLNRYERETNYVNELTSTSNNPRTNSNVNDNLPSDQLTSTTFFNSVGMNFGIKYRIF